MVPGIRNRRPSFHHQVITSKLINLDISKQLDLITDLSHEKKNSDVLSRLGKINKLTKFDSEYFGQDYMTDHYKDPMLRLLLERCHEAIIDAGNVHL